MFLSGKQVVRAIRLRVLKWLVPAFLVPPIALFALTLWLEESLLSLIAAIVTFIVATSLLFVMRFVLQRERKRIRGFERRMCPNCEQDLRGIPEQDGLLTCPECGSKSSIAALDEAYAQV